MRGHTGRCIAIADGVGVVTPVRVFAVTVLAPMTPLALAARDVVLQEYQVPLLESLAFGERAAGPGDVPDVLMAHDHRSARRRFPVQPHIGSADPGDLHFQ